MVHRGLGRQARPRAHDPDADLGEKCDRRVDGDSRIDRGLRLAAGEPRGRDSGERLTEKVIWQLLRPYAVAAGVPGIAPHDLRSYTEFRTMPNEGADCTSVTLLMLDDSA